MTPLWLLGVALSFYFGMSTVLCVLAYSEMMTLPLSDPDELHIGIERNKELGIWYVVNKPRFTLTLLLTFLFLPLIVGCVLTLSPRE